MVSIYTSCARSPTYWLTPFRICLYNGIAMLGWMRGISVAVLAVFLLKKSNNLKLILIYNDLWLFVWLDIQVMQYLVKKYQYFPIQK